MTIAAGDTLPDATFLVIGPEGPVQKPMVEVLSGGKAIIFGLPGAFTGTCTTAHVPSFIRTKDQFAAKGYDTIACVSVNDPFVMGAWGESTGAAAAGIQMLADPAGAFIQALGLTFDAPPVGLLNRSKRFSMVVEDGKVTHLHVEDSPGVCETSAGETLLYAL